MWSYYGSKAKIAKYYPPPKYNLIIEPFAGAAWYSILHRDHDVLLNDNYTVVYEIWNWLIKEATSEELLKYKDFYVGQDIRDFHLKTPHRNLIGFCANRGSTSPCHIIQKWCCQSKIDFEWASTIAYRLQDITKKLPEIKHWEVESKDYSDLPNLEATWFIDPPYNSAGSRYNTGNHNLDYAFLADWCQSRKGQVIVCEGTNAKWLPFKPLKLPAKYYGQRARLKEYVYVG